MNKLLVTMSFAAVFCFALACGDGNGPRGESFTVDTLEGSYQIQDECTAEFNGSVATLDGCVLEGLFGRSPISVESGRVAFGEERISVDGTAHEMADTECYGMIESDITIEGQFDKNEGRQVDGPFTALAGNWTGTIDVTESVSTTEPIAGAPARCETLEAQSLDHSLDVEAEVYGDRIDVTTDRGSFVITSDGEQVTVDGDAYVKQ